MRADRTDVRARGAQSSAGRIWISVAAIAALAFTVWMQTETVAQRNWPELQPVEHVEGTAGNHPMAPVAAAQLPERLFNATRAANPFDRSKEQSQWKLAEAMKPAPANGADGSRQASPSPVNAFGGNYPWPDPVNNAPKGDRVRVVQSATQQAMQTMVGGAVDRFTTAASSVAEQSATSVNQAIDKAQSEVANRARAVARRIPQPVTQILRPQMNDGRIRLPQVNVPAVKQAVQDGIAKQAAQMPKLQTAVSKLQSLPPISESKVHAVKSSVRELVDDAAVIAQNTVESTVQNPMPRAIRVPDLSGGSLKLPSVSIPKPKQAGLVAREVINGRPGPMTSTRITLPNAAAPLNPTIAELPKEPSHADTSTVNFPATPAPDEPVVNAPQFRPESSQHANVMPHPTAQNQVALHSVEANAANQQTQFAAPRIHIPPPPPVSPNAVQRALPTSPSLMSKKGLPTVQSPTTVQPTLDLSRVNLSDLALPTVQAPTVTLPPIRTAQAPPPSTSLSDQQASPAQTPPSQIASPQQQAIHSMNAPRAANPARPSGQPLQAAFPASPPTNPPASGPTSSPAWQIPDVAASTSSTEASQVPLPHAQSMMQQASSHPTTTPALGPQQGHPATPQSRNVVNTPPNWQLPNIPAVETPNLDLPQIQTPQTPQIQTPLKSPPLNSALGLGTTSPHRSTQAQPRIETAAKPAHGLPIPQLPEFKAPELLSPNTNSSLAGNPGSSAKKVIPQPNPLAAPSQTQSRMASIPKISTPSQAAAATQQSALRQPTKTQPATTQLATTPPTTTQKSATRDGAEANSDRASAWGHRASAPESGFVIPQMPPQQPASEFTTHPTVVPQAPSTAASQNPAKQPTIAEQHSSNASLPSKTQSTQQIASAVKTKGHGEIVEASRVLALVGNQPILAGDVLGQVNQMLEQYEGKVPAEELEKQRKLLVQQALPSLVDNKLIFSDFLSGIPVEKLPDLEKRVFDIFAKSELPKLMEKTGVKSAKELDAKLRKFGSSMEKQRRLFMEKAVAQQQMQSKISFDREVKHEEMLEFYENNINDYYVEARAKFEHLMVRFDKFDSFDAAGNYDEDLAKKSARAAIAEMGNQVMHGAPMTEVAKRSSHGPFAEQGGVHDWTTKGALASVPMDQALFKLPVGKLSQIIEDEQGLHIMRIIDREPAGNIPFSEVQTKIAETIKQRRFQEGVKKYLATLRARTHVRTIFDEGESAKTLMARPNASVLR